MCIIDLTRRGSEPSELQNDSVLVLLSLSGLWIVQDIRRGRDHVGLHGVTDLQLVDEFLNLGEPWGVGFDKRCGVL